LARNEGHDNVRPRVALIATVHYVDLVVTSLARSLPFYQDLLGWTETGEIVGERGERVVYIRPPGRSSQWYASLGLREKQSDAGAAPYDRYAVGIHHLAFVAESRGEVDDRAEWLRGCGAEIESGPREYDYMPGYYAVFFYDPDRMKLEIVHHLPREAG
jgi:catechol 2,3-dioxygenase-like lactoylglutathione lyase family enzyme